MYQNHIIMVLLIEDPLCLTLEWPNENTSLETYPVHKPNMGIFLCKIWLMFYWIYNSHLPDNFRHEMMTKNSKIEGHSSMPSLLKWKNMEHEIRTYSNPLLECGDSIEGVVYCGGSDIFLDEEGKKNFLLLTISFSCQDVDCCCLENPMNDDHFGCQHQTR